MVVRLVTGPVSVSAATSRRGGGGGNKGAGGSVGGGKMGAGAGAGGSMGGAAAGAGMEASGPFVLRLARLPSGRMMAVLVPSRSMEPSGLRTKKANRVG